MNDLESILRRLIREEIRTAFEEVLPKTLGQHEVKPLDPADGMLLSSRDAAKRLSISERTLFTLTKSGQLPCVRIGTSKRYSIETLKNWIHTSESEAAPPPRQDTSSPEPQKPDRQKTVMRGGAKRKARSKLQGQTISSTIVEPRTCVDSPPWNRRLGLSFLRDLVFSW